MRSFVFICVLSMVVDRLSCQEWNYGEMGPDVWRDNFPSCARHYQSPINIQTACTTYQPFTPFSFSSAYNLSNNFMLINNGHTVSGTYNGTDSSSFNLTGGGLNGTFQFSNFHLHWGENYRSGSEHQVNGVKYAGEIHFVHVNPMTSQTAVLSIFMQSSQTQNQSDDVLERRAVTLDEWERYFATADTLQTENKFTVLNLNLASLMGSNLNDFWRYEGSLTIPPCTEGIIWSVFKIPILFSESEIGSFRKNIFFEDFRGPQPLYGRSVYRNFPEQTLSSVPDYNICPKSLNSACSPTGKQLVDSTSFLMLFILIELFFHCIL